ncbi:MAG: DUF5678 domain-containing protein [Acidobacteriota bacterium]
MSSITVENILQQIVQLPPAEQRRLAHLMEEQQAKPGKAPLDKRVPAQSVIDRTREWQWIEDHKREYPGQWVALEGDRLVAASPVQQEVYDALKTAGAKRPLIHRISSPDDLPYIGI